MLDQIKRKDDLARVNQKFGGKVNDSTPQTPAKVLDDDTMLQKTTNLLDEAEKMLSPSD